MTDFATDPAAPLTPMSNAQMAAGLSCPIPLGQLNWLFQQAFGLSTDGSETKVNAGSRITVTGTGTAADPYIISADVQAPDGSETKLSAGTNITISGTGTAADPYVISAVLPALATLADLLTESTSTGNLITDDVLRQALGSGQNRRIDVARNGSAIKATSLDASDYALAGYANGTGERAAVFGLGSNNNPGIFGQAMGSRAGVVGYGLGAGNGVESFNFGSAEGNGIYAVILGSSSGHAVRAQVSGNGSGNAINAAINNAQNGHAGHFDVGYGAAFNGTGRAIYAVNGPGGNRNSVGEFLLAGSNTAWGLYTNGAIYTAGGVTTSDARLKRKVIAIEPQRAAEFSRKVQFHSYDKLVDAASVEAIGAEVRRQSAVRLHELEAADTSIEGFDRRAHKSAIAEAKEACNACLNMGDDALLIGRQAGVIAQQLQLLLTDYPEFDFLVRPTDPNDPQSMLVVDYTSLFAIVSAGFQARMEAAGL